MLARRVVSTSRVPGASRHRPALAVRCAAKLASPPPAAAAATSSFLKETSQSYISNFVVPVAKSRQQVFAHQEQAFDKLLLTPDLDKRLAQGDTQVQQAVHIVESAVAAAVQLAFHSSPAAAAAGHSAHVDGSSVADGGESHAEEASSSFGCIALNSEEQCVVDWDSEFLWDNSAAAAAASMDAAAAPGHEHAHDGVVMTALPHGPDDAGASQQNAKVIASIDSLAHAAVALEGATGESFEVASAHTFLQRLLYKINRLNHFWYDDLSNYINERSLWLARLRDTIEEPWQDWELQQLQASPDVAGGVAWGRLEGYQGLTPEQLKEALTTRYEADVSPPLSPAQQFVAKDMDALGYCHLLAVGSVDGLVEASRQSRVCAGAANQVACTIFSEAAVRLLRRIHPHTAALLRSRCTTGAAAGGSLATSQRRQSNVRVLGLQRPLFVALVGAAAVYCLVRSGSWLRLLLAAAVGVSLLACHASLRSPNLKARLASAREEFRAVWRGYQADIARSDYTL